MKQAMMNGEVFSFPDSMDDAEIDQIMLRHGQGGGATPAAAPAQEVVPAVQGPMGGEMPQVDPMIPMLIQGLAGFFNQQKQAQAMEATQAAEATKADMEARGAECAQKLQVLGGIGQALVALAEQSTNLQSIGAVVPAIEKLSEDIQQMTMSNNNLAQTIVEVGTAIIQTMRMPREIYHKQGVPVGIQVTE